MEKREIKVGQTVYLKPQCNAARYSKEIRVGVVKKVGVKYFEIEEFRNCKFSFETMEIHSNYTSDWKVYLTKQDIQDEYDYKDLSFAIKNKSFTLEQLREINTKYQLLTPNP